MAFKNLTITMQNVSSGDSFLKINFILTIINAKYPFLFFNAVAFFHSLFSYIIHLWVLKWLIKCL
jgi:hypothetical protein